MEGRKEGREGKGTKVTSLGEGTLLLSKIHFPSSTETNKTRSLTALTNSQRVKWLKGEQIAH